MSNQLSVLLTLVNEADTQRTNLTTIGKIKGKPVRVMVDTVARVSAIKGKFVKKIYGDVPFSAVQTGKDSLHLRRITYTLPLYLWDIQFPREFQVAHNLAYDVTLGRDFL